MAKRILIVDDSVTIQKAFAMTFGGEDVTLMAARSADEGLTMARRSIPDLVIADGVMPGRSGYELCAALKSEPALRGVPVYLLTSSHNPYDESHGRQVAADGQFVKPFESGAIVAGVSEALAKGARGAAAVAIPFFAPPAAFAQTGMSADTAGADDYGEISVGGSGSRPRIVLPARKDDEQVVTPPPVVTSAPPARPIAQAAAPGMRPSLIPGMRPGVPAARPGVVPSRSPGLPGTQAAPMSAHAAPAPSPVPRGPVPQQPPVGQMRTMMGLPAGGLQPPPRAPAPLAAPLFAKPAPLAEVRTPAAAPSIGIAAQAASAVASRVAEKMATISARGPEYEAIAKLSREIIEKIVWEIVPELAEAIVRDELQKRGRL